MIHDGTGSVEGGIGWYLVVLVQYESVLVGTWWYWVSIVQLIHDATWSVQGGTGW